MKINNNEEFEEFYPYDKKYIKEYPKKYPCYAYWEYVDAGLMGDYRQVYITYPPENVVLESFELGLYAKYEEYN